MGKSIFHSSIEGGQHGPKGLEGFLAFAKQAGAAGAQPTCYMLENGKGGFKTAAEIKDTFAKYGLKFDGISCHCFYFDYNFRISFPVKWVRNPLRRSRSGPRII